MLDKAMEPVTAEEKADVQNIHYRELFGSLTYLGNTTRPDISYILGLLSRYMENTGNSHWCVRRHVVRYLLGTVNYGIRFRITAPEGGAIV